MRIAIPQRLRLRSALVLLALSGLFGCSHSGEEARLAGYWEGALPLPATGEPLPIAYDFRADDNLIVTLGLGESRTVTVWERWEVHSTEGGHMVLHIHRHDGRTFATLARHVGDDELLLWDLGTDASTAARVRRVSRPEGEEPEEPAPEPVPEPAGE